MQVDGHYLLTDTNQPVFLRAFCWEDVQHLRNVDLKCYDHGVESWKRYQFSTKVALVSQRVVGYWIAGDHEQTVNILRLGVTPKYRRRGIGSILMDDLLQSFVASDVRLAVTESQGFDGAFYFLKKCGFKCRTKLQTGHYLFWKELC